MKACANLQISWLMEMVDTITVTPQHLPKYEYTIVKPLRLTSLLLQAFVPQAACKIVGA